jgi:SAM-dependent methyltransferase
MSAETLMSPEILQRTLHRLDGPLRWALQEGRTLVTKAGVREGWHVLDVGCGTGYCSLPLAEAVGENGTVTCLDQSLELLGVLEAKARKRGLWPRLRLQRGAAPHLPGRDRAYDAVFCSYLLHELGDDAQRLVAEAHRVLRPHAPLVVADFRRLPDEERCAEINRWYRAQKEDEPGAEEGPNLRFSLDDLETMFVKAGFHVVELTTWLDFHMHGIAWK